MLDKIDLLRANERNLDEDTHREVERKKVEYHKRLIRVLVVSPFSHQMSLLALGGLSIFHEINTRNDIAGICDRAFFYDFLFDEKGEIREEYRGLPFLSFDRKIPITDFDIVAYGMTNPGGITDFVKFMRLAGLPLKRRERENKDYPIIIGGGPAFAT